MNTIWVLGDQLSPTHAALTAHSPSDGRVLMIESKARGSVMRYHKQKLVLVYSAMRHFAEELRGRGWLVDYHLLENTDTFEAGLRQHVQQFRPACIRMAEPNSLPETDAIQRLCRKLNVPLEFLPTAQFLLPRSEFREWAAGQTRLLMENHYRRMRKRHGWLLDKHGNPEGGRWNFDEENRQTFAAWDRAGRPHGKTPLRAEPNAATRKVMALVEREFAQNPGSTADFWLPVTRAEAQQWLQLFIKERLPQFGVFEDMMAVGEPILFHSVLTPMLNIGILTPSECIETAIKAYADGQAALNSVEGFVRQIAGWREFINGVYWHRGPDYKQLNALGAERPLPAWFYSGDVPMNCLQQSLRQTLSLGWNHHIQRLMVLGNFMLISGINPQQGLRWFSEMYVDAFDWVMAPNVIGMSLHADGGYMATKPYAAGSGYIRKMSDYCKNCRFDPDEKTGPKACPFNYLYWHFIDQHSERFFANARMRTIVSTWMKRPESAKATVRASAETFLAQYVPE